MAYVYMVIIFFFIGIIAICLLAFITAIVFLIISNKKYKNNPESNTVKRKCLFVIGITVVPLLSCSIFVINTIITAVNYPSDFVKCDAVESVTEEEIVINENEKLVRTEITTVLSTSSLNKSVEYSVYLTGFNKCNSYNIYKTVIDGFDYYFYIEDEATVTNLYVKETELKAITSYYSKNGHWKNVPEDLIPIFEKYNGMSEYKLELAHSDFNYYEYNENEGLYVDYVGVNIHNDGTYLIYKAMYDSYKSKYSYYGIKLEGEDEEFLRSYYEKNIKITCSEYSW